MGKSHDISKLIAMQLNEAALASHSAPEESTARKSRSEPRLVPKTRLRSAVQKNVVFAAIALTLAIVIAVFTASRFRIADSAPGSELDSIFRSALADYQRIDRLPSKEKPAAFAGACKTLGNAIASVESESREKANRLRRLLIPCLLQLKDPRFSEVERQLVLLNEPPGDPQGVKWMALALIGQIQAGTYKDRTPGKYQQQHDYWSWLSHQPPGEVLFDALDHYPLSVQLIDHLVELAENSPELFACEKNVQTGTQDQCSLRNRVRDRVARLTTDESSHSLLVRYRFELPHEPRKANKILARGADQAERRLLSIDQSLGSEQTDQEPILTSFTRRSKAFWDFALLIQYAQTLHQTDPDLAARYYRCLTSIKSDQVPAKLIEKAYLSSGRLAVAQGHPTDALRIWKLGIERENRNSLELFGAMVSLATTKGTAMLPDDDREILRSYQTAINANALRLSKASPDEMTLADRTQLGREILAARWRSRVLESHLISQTDAKGDAMEIMRLALTQSVDVDPSEQILAFVQLADWYLAEGAADSAATCFEQAIGFDPTNNKLRQKASEAWMAAGNRTRSAEHMQKITGNESLCVQLQHLEAVFQNSMRQHGDSSEVGIVQDRLRALQDEIQGQRYDVADSPELREICSRMEIIQACLPHGEMSLEEHVKSAGFRAEITAIANEYRDVEPVQQFAVELLASLGSIDEAESALTSLRTVQEPNSTEVVVETARVLAASGRSIAASRQLLSHDGKNDAETRNALVLAAEWALRANDKVIAYDALATIPSSHRTCRDLFLLAKLAKQLPADGETILGRNVTRSKLVKRWKTELKNRERDSCGFNTCLEVHSLIAQLSARNDVIRFDDPQLVQAKQLIRDLISQRPGWSETAILTAKLSVIEGNSHEAMQVLRDAVMAGNESPELHRQLHKLQNRKQSNPHRWARFASASQSIDATPKLQPHSHNIRQLVDAHQWMTSTNPFDLPATR